VNNIELPDRNNLLQAYAKYREIWAMVSKDLEDLIEEAVCPLPSRPTVKGRIKDFSSYYKKYIKLLKESPSGETPLITDLIGIRIVCPFIDDIPMAEEAIKKKLDVIEIDRKGADYTFKEFGYESTHLLINIPDTILEVRGACGVGVAEIQIRTILQEAWAEVEHELVYKAEFTPFDEPMKRKLAAVNASLALADITFQEIRSYQRQLNGELEKRRDSFFKKIEESIDRRLFSEKYLEEELTDYRPMILPAEKSSIDDLLLNALYAHNKNKFEDAIRFYSRILEMKPNNSVASLIYKHRGMANFAQSYYEEAVKDFSHSLELEPQSYKAAYYRGIVRSVEQRYIEAIDDFTLSLKINPYQNFCFYRRGQAYYHIGDYPQALADCEAAFALDPNSEQIKKFKGLLLEKLKM
jgi:putative GTP pyrophosphokinase